MFLISILNTKTQTAGVTDAAASYDRIKTDANRAAVTPMRIGGRKELTPENQW
jgi:hypothetical protein